MFSRMRMGARVAMLLAGILIGAGLTFEARAADESNVLAQYHFDDGEDRVVDHGPNNFHGTLYGATFSSAADGHALQISRNGMAKCAHRRRMLTGTGPLFVEFWLKLDELKNGTVIGKKGQTDESAGWMVSYDAQDRQLVFSLSDGDRQVALRAPLVDLDWHHVVAMRAGKRVAIYIDGREMATRSDDAFAIDISNDSVFLFLGKVIGFYGVEGRLDDVTIAGASISADAVAARYTASQARRGDIGAAERSGPLLVHYTFDEQTGDTYADASGYGHDATIVGNVQYLDEAEGRRGVARFDGSSYLALGDSDALNFAGDMSVEMWVRLNGPVENQWATIFGDWPVRNWYIVLAHFHTIMLYYTDGHDNNLVPVQRQLLDDQWAHIAIVVEYPRTRFYRNGELVRDQYMAVPGVPLRGKAAKFLGGNERAGIPIDLDEFRFYRRPLTEAEVQAHARSEDPSPQRTESLAVETNWYTDQITLRLTGKNHDYHGCTAELSLQDESQAILMAEPFPGSGRFTAEAAFALTDRQGASITATARVKARDGTVVAELNEPVTLTKPDWVDNREGFSASVPAPWTPVEAARQGDAVRVGVWGRSQTFGRTPIAHSIVTQERELLAAPIALRGTADGDALAWGEAHITLEGSSETAADIEQSFICDRAQLRIATNIEYDGYMTIECTVEAQRDIALSELTLDIPIRSQYAKLAYGDRVLPRDPKVPISEWFSGAIEGDLSFKFGPTVFIGNARRGLLWQGESDEDWRNADRQRAIEILPRGETTFFRHHFVDKPTELKAGDTLTYRFALQALPNKPLLRDAWDLRIVRHEPWGRDFDLPDREINGMPAIDYLRQVGVRRLFTRKSDLWPWPMPLREDFQQRLTRLTEAVHAGGLKLHQYVIHQRVPVLVDAFDPHGRHMAKAPIRQYMQGANNDPVRPGPVEVGPDAPPQGAIFHCPKSMALQDAYIYALAQRTRAFDEDGIYLDGTLQCPPCENTLHGCGYYDQDGQLHQTYPVFAVRKFMQRIYTVIKSEDPEHIVDNHCSWGYNPAGLAYGDTMWTGEQWYHLRHGGSDYIAGDLSMAQYMTEFTGWQVGVAAETLHYRLGSRLEVAAISLLFDIPVRPAMSRALGKTPEDPYWQRITKVWAMRDRFDAQHAENLYFFENEQYVQTSPERVYATLLTHPTNGVLALISNLHPDAQRAAVDFNLDALGFESSNVTAINGLSDEQMSLAADGMLTTDLGSHEWVYVWLRPAGD